MSWLTAHARPDVQWFAVPNGDLRHPRVAMRLKAEGVRPGVADLCFMLPEGRTGWLELKAKRGVLSDEQKGFAARAMRLGHYWSMVRSVDEAAAVLARWDVVRDRA